MKIKLRTKVAFFVAVILMISITSFLGLQLNNRKDSIETISNVFSTPTKVASLDEEFADDSLLVVMRNNYDNSLFSELKQLSSVRDLTEGLDNPKYRILQLELLNPSKENVLETISVLGKNVDVLSAEPNYITEINKTPNNPLYSREQWALQHIDMPVAWDVNTNASKLTVGVMDTGIDATHPSLVNRINTSLFRDFTGSSDNVLVDYAGHGTHVAGIIGSQADNGIGTSGVTWNISMVSLKVFNRNGQGDIAFLIEAIKFATQNKFNLLNFIGGGSESSVAFRAAIENFGGLFVAAAGNEDLNNDIYENFPSNYRLPNLISVGASSRLDRRSDYSNYGKNTVDIFAPGDDIASTYPRNLPVLEEEGVRPISSGYVYMDGTSMATPIVTGVAALMLSFDSNLTATRIKSIIMETVDTNVDVSIKNFSVSGGRLNAGKALMKVADNNGVIFTAQQLNNIRNNPFGSFRLGKSINIAEFTSNWTPIPQFWGSLNGNGYAISNLKITIPTNTSTQNFGLFGELSGASIDNLVFSSVDIKAPTQNNAQWINVGAIAGTTSASTIIYNSHVSGISITNAIDVDRIDSSVGGLVGVNRGLIINSVNNSSVYGTGDLGGIAGRNTGVIQNSANSGRI
ncbi:MAG: S8 family serine peptidase, partial [Clostridiales bacterium]|nr:S8 family serine peptidase [Clostridiales bacterium]